MHPWSLSTLHPRLASTRNADEARNVPKLKAPTSTFWQTTSTTLPPSIPLHVAPTYTSRPCIVHLPLTGEADPAAVLTAPPSIITTQDPLGPSALSALYTTLPPILLFSWTCWEG